MRLEIWSKSHGSRTVDVPSLPCLVGRSPECDIVVEDPGVSSHHMEILRMGATYRLKDLDSRNGLWFDGKRVAQLDVTGTTTVYLGDLEVRILIADAEVAPTIDLVLPVAVREGLERIGSPSSRDVAGAGRASRPAFVVAGGNPYPRALELVALLAGLIAIEAWVGPYCGAGHLTSVGQVGAVAGLVGIVLTRWRSGRFQIHEIVGPLLVLHAVLAVFLAALPSLFLYSFAHMWRIGALVIGILAPVFVVVTRTLRRTMTLRAHEAIGWGLIVAGSYVLGLDVNLDARVPLAPVLLGAPTPRDLSDFVAGALTSQTSGATAVASAALTSAQLGQLCALTGLLLLLRQTWLLLAAAAVGALAGSPLLPSFAAAMGGVLIAGFVVVVIAKRGRDGRVRLQPRIIVLAFVAGVAAMWVWRFDQSEKLEADQKQVADQIKDLQAELEESRGPDAQGNDLRGDRAIARWSEAALPVVAPWSTLVDEVARTARVLDHTVREEYFRGPWRSAVIEWYLTSASEAERAEWWIAQNFSAALQPLDASQVDPWLAGNTEPACRPCIPLAVRVFASVPVPAGRPDRLPGACQPGAPTARGAWSRDYAALDEACSRLAGLRASRQEARELRRSYASALSWARRRPAGEYREPPRPAALESRLASGEQ